MSFNQGFGPPQGFSTGFPQNQQNGAWPNQQQLQQQQHQLHSQHQSQRFPQGWQNQEANQQGYVAANFGWQGPPNNMQFQNLQGAHSRQQIPQNQMLNPHQPHPGNVAAQNQEVLKRHQFEEQKRKLMELSSRGGKPKQKDGKNMIDDLISKADLGLSAISQTGFKNSSFNRPTNVFTAQSKPEAIVEQTTLEGQVLSHNSSQFAPSFSQQSEFSMTYQTVQAHPPNLPQLQPSQNKQQPVNFGPSFAAGQQGSPQLDDDFGDFQGGKTVDGQDQGLGSLHSSSSSVSSLKSSFNSGSKHTSAPNPDHMMHGLSVSAALANQQQPFVVGTNLLPSATATDPYSRGFVNQNAGQLLESKATFSEGPNVVSSLSYSYGASFPNPTSYPPNSGPAFPPTSIPGYPPDSLSAFPGPVDVTLGASIAAFDSKPVEGVTTTDEGNMEQKPEIDDDRVCVNESLYGCKLPSWIHDPIVRPPVYKKVLDKSLSLDGSIDTSKVTDVLLSSNIPKDTLRDIWGMANKKNPGILVEDELFVILGLVALSQAGWTKLSISKLSSCNTAPIPEFPEHILMDLPTGSVFGGDALVMDSDSQSSSPVDPDDKYSVFRSHNKDVLPVLSTSVTLLSSTSATDSDAAPFGWGADLANKLPSDVSESNQKYISNEATQDDESWADFQVSGSAVEVKSIESNYTGHAQRKQELSERIATPAEFLQCAGRSKTASMADASGELEQGERKQDDFTACVSTSSKVGDIPNVKAGFSAEFDIEKISKLGTKSNSGIVTGTVTSFESSIGASFDTMSTTMASVCDANIPDPLFHPQQSIPIPAGNHALSSFLSITSSDDIAALDHTNRAKQESSSVATSAFDFATTFSEGAHAGESNAMNESWNEFTSFDACPGSIAPSDAAPNPKKQVTLKNFAAPLDSGNPLAAPLDSGEEGDIFPRDKTFIASGSRENAFQDSSQSTCRRTSNHENDEFLDFSFQKPVTDNQISSGMEMISHDNDIISAPSFEFADFATFDPKTATEKGSDLISTPQGGSQNAGLPHSTMRETLGDLSIVALNQSSDSNTKPSFVPSQKPLDINSQISSFDVTTNAGSKSDSFRKELSRDKTSSSPKKSHERAFVGPALDAKDRYKALTGVLEDTELHVHEWKQCLNGVKRVLESASTAIKKHNLSLNTKKEVFESDKGKEFFNNLKEIYAVACRIRISIDSSAIAKSNEDLKNLLMDIERLWREIAALSTGLPEYGFPDSSSFPMLNRESAGAHCGICLLGLNEISVELCNWKMSIASLNYGSKTYHSTCANFWCNKVNPVLPALSPLVSGLL